MPTIISANLKRLCKLKELTVAQLAEKSEVSVRTIERIRSGTHVPDNQTISLLAKALGQKPEHLVEGAIEKRKTEQRLAEKQKALKDEMDNFTERERKDFTKFERDLSRPKELTGWAKDLKDLLELIDREHQESNALAERAKRQIIAAVILTAAFLLSLYVAIS